jgi:hypothetical protein
MLARRCMLGVLASTRRQVRSSRATLAACTHMRSVFSTTRGSNLALSLRGGGRVLSACVLAACDGRCTVSGG